MDVDKLSLAEFYDLIVEEGVEHPEAGKALGYQTPNGFSGALSRGDIDLPRYKMGRKVIYLKRDIAAEIQRRRIGGKERA